MAGFNLILQLALAALALNLVHGGVNQVPLPQIDLNEWWGPGNASAVQNTSIWKFEIKFSEEMICDLRDRLIKHRPFTPPLEGVALEYGCNSVLLKKWVNYFAQDYPFEEREDYLNQFPQYMTNVNGIPIHFIRVKSQNKKVLKQTKSRYTPLLLLHGWPGSVREFYEAIPILISLGESRGIAFDIIVPSLPGFGFSGAAAKPGLGVDKSAIVLRNLMHRVGHSQFYVQAGDMGALIATCMATFFQKEVLGYHTNFPLLHTPEMIVRLLLGNFHPEEITTSNLLNRIYPSLEKFFDIITFSGYLHIQATKPDTIGVGIDDSPSGLIAYIFEKSANNLRQNFIHRADGGIFTILTPEQMFDNIMFYWVPKSFNTAIRLYSETFNKRYVKLRINEIKSTVPAWVLQAPDELCYLPGWMIKMKFVNLLGETLPDEGGHYYAWEKPQHFAEDVVNAVVAFKHWHAQNSTMRAECSKYCSN